MKKYNKGNNVYKLILLLATLLFSISAFSGTSKGKITNIYVADNSFFVLFKLDSDIKDTPRCNEQKRFSISLGKPGGMAAYTAILEAKRNNYVVSVKGLNTCVNEWKSEDIKNIILE